MPCIWTNTPWNALWFDINDPGLLNDSSLKKGTYIYGNFIHDSVQSFGMATLPQGTWGALISDTVTIDSIDTLYELASGTFSATFQTPLSGQSGVMVISNGTFRNFPIFLGLPY